MAYQNKTSYSLQKVNMSPFIMFSSIHSLQNVVVIIPHFSCILHLIHNMQNVMFFVLRLVV